jgi:hypothetical protein
MQKNQKGGVPVINRRGVILKIGGLSKKPEVLCKFRHKNTGLTGDIVFIRE